MWKLAIFPTGNNHATDEAGCSSLANGAMRDHVDG
jgi:hypothetical protein